MGKFKKTMAFEKENMPEYQYNFLYHRVGPGFIFVLGGALICVIFVIIGAVLNKMLLGLIPFCLWVVVTFILLFLFVVYFKKMTKRLENDKTKEFEDYYTLIDYETAKNEMAKENFIKDGKLILQCENEDGSTTQETINLEDCEIYFFCFVRSGVYYLMLEFYRKADNESLMSTTIDKNNYTFFAHNIDLIKNDKLFRLFIEDKREFTKLLLKYNSSYKMEKKIKDKE